MNTDAAPVFFSGLMTEFQSPALLFQLLVLAGCLLVGWWLSRWLVRCFTTPESWAGGSAPVDSFHRVLAPLLSAVLLAVSVAGLNRWQNVGTLRLALPLLLAFLLIRVLFFMLRKAFVKEGHVGRVLQSVEQIIAVIVWLGLALYVTGLWPELVLLLEQTTLPLGRHRESLLVILQALMSVAVTVMIALWASAVLERRLMQFDAVHSSIRVVLARTGRALFLLVAVLISLSLVGIDLTVLSVFGGALGVGLGLGLQKLVSSYVSGMVILIERSLALGDIVSVDKYRGEVVQINARCTILRASDGSEAMIPNEMMVSSPVQNFSRSDQQVRLSSQLFVGYQTDINEFATLARRAIEALPGVLAEPAPDVLILRLAQEGVVLEVGLWIADPVQGSGALLSEVNRRLLDLIRSRNVLIPQASEKDSSV
ncbi:MAG: mechanosensitive ion channel family protein [Oxalobacteraceae bacterium]